LRFIQSSTFLVFKAFKLTFSGEVFDDSQRGNFVSFMADPRLVSREFLYLKIRCQHLDRQVASAKQILDTLSPVLAVVEKLTLVYVVTEDPPPTVLPVYLIDRIQWREILRSFSGVKTLHVKDELVGVISRCLRSEAGKSPLELLPNLEELTYSKFDIGDMFMPFLKQRQAAGYPVTVRRESSD
jgi:hypothetical protein